MKQFFFMLLLLGAVFAGCNDDGYRLAVDVTVGETVDGSTIIKSGLTAGEQVTIN